MPTNAELSKQVEALEDKLNNIAKGTSELIFGKILLRMKESGIDVVELKREVDSLSSSVEHLNGLLEDMRCKNSALSDENTQLRSQNQSLTRRVEELEQYSRLSNVEIKGIPCTQGEDCVEILKTVGDKIGCPILPYDLDIVHRVPTRSIDKKNIIARFCSRTKKADFVSKARKARLCLSDIGLSSQSKFPVFVNEHLTACNKTLFSKALSLKKEKKWLFLWTDNCQIKARKTTTSKVLRIRDESDLNKIV
ncbi:uncharacterized protein LOC142817632 [Rhipicephalus microplus]|uniref:uncharacterized protein LOC142775469 n=1 Tax=Rhipicephalus microplus TaxID=6941 RepID=UPI0018880BAE|nr:uncharacterized protein LOC119161962 [Rhipicephalus microplus]